jgi:acid phosphatase
VALPRAPQFVRLRVAICTVTAAISALAAAGCGSAVRLAPQTVPSPRAAVAGGAPRHIAVIVMENEEYGSILDSRETPFIHSLASRYALATSSYAITHPSLPNYLALTSGSTFGIDSDCTDCSVPGAGVAGQLTRRGITWRAYIEGLPDPCFTGAGAGTYAKKHNPFLYYTGIIGNRAACAHVVPLRGLFHDERRAALPAFVWITPNLCHDMHDCPPATGDRFLKRLVPPLLRALGPRGLLILTWDEGSTDNGCCRLAGGGHIVTILAGGLARPGARLRTPVDHYSVLQTIEDVFGLPRRGGAACACTASLSGLLRAR